MMETLNWQEKQLHHHRCIESPIAEDSVVGDSSVGVGNHINETFVLFGFAGFNETECTGEWWEFPAT